MQKYFAFFLIVVQMLVPVATFADSISFNPQYVLSDTELSNWHAMDLSDVQNFLSHQTGALAMMSLPDLDGVQKSAAEIILNAARRNQINPKVLLVMLQKEQSLVTDPSPSMNSIGWAMGYALCDGCDSNDPKIAKYKGFAIQVDDAAGSLRFYIDHVGDKSWIKRAGQSLMIDNTQVIPATNATAFLYTYTPHLEGNRNFWNIWQLWFHGRVFPDGVLIKTEADPTVWYIDNGTRRMIPSMAVLASYFDPSSIITVEPQDRDTLQEGDPMRFPNYAVIHTAEDDHTYLNVDETLYPFTSKEVIRALGFSPAEVVEAQVGDLNGYEHGTFITPKSTYPTGAVLKGRKSGSLFYVQNGNKYPILDPILLITNFKSVKPGIVSDKALGDYLEREPLRIKDGAVVAVKGKPEVYLISHGLRRHTANDKVFEGLGLTQADVVTVSDKLLALHPPGPDVTLSSTDVPPVQTALNSQ